MYPKVQIKGIKDGLLVTLGEGTWEEVHLALLEQIDQQGEFLKGARLAVDVGNLVLKAAEIGQLQKELVNRELNLWAVLSNSPLTEQSAQSFGLATRIARPQPLSASQRTDSKKSSTQDAIWIRRTLRSGSVVENTGHVVVIGDVNPGAEIIANGDIVVWGKLRGSVHAGFEGDQEAIVCALDLSPMQLRIAGELALPAKKSKKPAPSTARIRDGQVVFENWDPKRERL